VANAQIRVQDASGEDASDPEDLLRPAILELLSHQSGENIHFCRGAPMHSISIRTFTPLVLATLALAACDKNPAGLRNDPGTASPSNAFAADAGTIPQAVKDAGKTHAHVLIPGFPDLTTQCTSGPDVVTGVAFDGTFIYVGHGDNQNACITRYNAATGAYMDQKFFTPDVRGLTWVSGLGKLVARTFGGWGGQFYSIDYAAGTSTLLTSYNAQSCNDQGQPSVDQDGLGYWTNCGNSLEHRRMSDGQVLTSVSVNPFFTATNPVGAATGGIGIFSGAANQYAVYDPGTSLFIANLNTVSSNGCQGYGLGVQADGSHIGVNLDCSNVRIETFAPGTHGPLTFYPGSPVTSHIILCKDASSPAGSYGYSILTTGTVAGDVAQTNAVLNPGQCRITFSRTAFSNATVTQTITEVPASGTVVHSITRTQFGTTSVFSGPNPTVSVSANSSHGGVVTYKNIAGAPPP